MQLYNKSGNWLHAFSHLFFKRKRTSYSSSFTFPYKFQNNLFITTEHLAQILMGTYLSIYLCYIWEVYSHYFFEYFFSPAPFLLSFLGTTDKIVRYFFYISADLSCCVHFFSLFSLFHSDQVISIFLSSSSQILFSLLSILLLKSTVWVFYISYCILQFKIFI